MRALYETGCDEICVSLNAGDARSYGAMMQTTPKNFDRVVENVRRAAALKRETGAETLVKVQFLVYKENFRQLPDMYRLFRETGADRFWLNGLYPVRPMPMMSDADVDEMLRAYEEVLADDYFERLERFSFWEKSISDRIDASTRRVFERAPLARRARVKVRHLFDPAGRRARSVAGLHEFCLVGWYSMTLNANGDAVTCCILQDHPTAVLGSIHSSSLSRDLDRSALRTVPGGARRDHGPARRGLRLLELLRGRGRLRREGRVPHALLLLGGRRRTSAASSTRWSRPCRCPPASPSRRSRALPSASPSTPASSSSRSGFQP